jgi:hypothetical protein
MTFNDLSEEDKDKFRHFILGDSYISTTYRENQLIYYKGKFSNNRTYTIDSQPLLGYIFMYAELEGFSLIRINLHIVLKKILNE